MKRKYSQYIKKLFIQKMQEELPEFAFWKSTKEQGLDYNFVKHDQDSWKMISVQHHHNEDSFMIEIMWSKTEEPKLYESEYIEKPLSIETIMETKPAHLRIRLPDFWTESFDAWWVIDRRGQFIKSIDEKGLITEDLYYQFYSDVGAILEDGPELTEEEMKVYIDPLVANAIKMIQKYAIPLYEKLDTI